LLSLRREARRELIVESHKHDAVKLLCTVPFLGPIRAAVLIARVQTPHRFRTKRQFWAYCGLALETRSSADYHFQEGQLVRARKPVFIRGLNLNHNHDLKNLFKGAATSASAMPGPFRTFYENLLVKGMQPAMARLTLARKIAAMADTVGVGIAPHNPLGPLAGVAALHFDVVDIFRIELWPDVARDVGVRHWYAVDQPARLVAAADVQLVVHHVGSWDKIRNHGKVVGIAGAGCSCDFFACYVRRQARRVRSGRFRLRGNAHA